MDKVNKRSSVAVAMPFIRGGSLVKQIVVALILGAVLAYVAPGVAASTGFLGSVFVSALKAVAPILVFVLVASAIANGKALSASNSSMKTIIVLYVLGTFVAATTAVLGSYIFPTAVELVKTDASMSSPSGILEVLRNLVMSAVDNPVNALLKANYIGILVWGIGCGVALRRASETTHNMLTDLSRCVEYIVRVVIRCAPIGIFGLVANTLATEGFGAMLTYGRLLCVLVGCMLFIALVINPIIFFICTGLNPYPMTLTVLRESGLTAFFTRSSAANIPVNMALCKKLGLDENTYGVSIPLGATINMAGAAITITVLAMSACYTLGIEVDIMSAILLSVLASLGACGAAGVPGGSLMLIPLACSLFGVDNNIAMQMVAVGFIIGAVQDSCETALNSSSDVLFTAAACLRTRRNG